MNRKLTALLLAMTFILSTMAPTMAMAETGKTGTKTTAVSVEKPKKGKWKLATLVAKVLGTKEDATLKEEKTETPKPNDGPTEDNSAAGENNQNEGSGKGSESAQTKMFDIFFSVSDGSKELAGAKLKILKGKEEVEKPWDTKETSTAFKLGSGDYELVMVTPPEGFKMAEPIKFKVTKKGEIEVDKDVLKPVDGKNVLVMKVEEAKKEPEKEKSKIYFGLFDSKDNEITAVKMTITKEGNDPLEVKSGEPFAYGKQEEGKYKFSVQAPKGYKPEKESIDFEITKDGEIDVDKEHVKTKDGKQILFMTAEKEAGKTFFGMKDSVGRDVAGATLQIREKKENDRVEVKYTWKSEEGMVQHTLDAGHYELVQVVVADGYTKAAPIAFDINDKGEIMGLSKDEHGDQYLALRVDPLESKTFFSLKDNRGNEIAGVELQIKKIGTEQIVKQWKSGKSPVDVKLEPGEYEFSQINVLPGYQLASSIWFKVADGKIIEAAKGLSAAGGQQVLSLVDGYVKHGIKFRRVKADGKDLAGTTIEIYKDGTKIAFWKSGSEANALELEPGVYRYHEAGIPDGHRKVADFEFEVKADGTISLGAVQIGDTVKLKDRTLIISGNEVKADPKEKSKQQKGAESIWIEFSLTKRSGGELSGAIAELYQGSTMVESWTSTDLSYLTRLQPGTYRFHVKTAPTGFAAPKDFEFTVKEDGSVTLGTIPAGETVTVKGGLITVIFETQAAAAAIAGGTTAQGGTKSNLPKTGDGISPVVYAAAIGVVGAVTLGIGLKKRREEIDEAK